MAATQRTRPDWVKALKEAAHRPIPEEEKARRREETKRLRALRDSLPSIAPDTAWQYIREIRDEEDARV